MTLYFRALCKSLINSIIWLPCREGESSREITTLKMEIQQIMKGEILYVP
jgi:hypothetical protein